MCSVLKDVVGICNPLLQIVWVYVIRSYRCYGYMQSVLTDIMGICNSCS